VPAERHFLRGLRNVLVTTALRVWPACKFARRWRRKAPPGD